MRTWILPRAIQSLLATPSPFRPALTDVLISQAGGPAPGGRISGGLPGPLSLEQREGNLAVPRCFSGSGDLKGLGCGGKGLACWTAGGDSLSGHRKGGSGRRWACRESRGQTLCPEAPAASWGSLCRLEGPATALTDKVLLAHGLGTQTCLSGVPKMGTGRVGLSCPQHWLPQKGSQGVWWERDL